MTLSFVLMAYRFRCTKFIILQKYFKLESIYAINDILHATSLVSIPTIILKVKSLAIAISGLEESDSHPAQMFFHDALSTLLRSKHPLYLVIFKICSNLIILWFILIRVLTKRPFALALVRQQQEVSIDFPGNPRAELSTCLETFLRNLF